MVGSGGATAGGAALNGRRDTRCEDAEVEAVLALGKAPEAGAGELGRFGRFGGGERRRGAEGARERWSMLSVPRWCNAEMQLFKDVNSQTSRKSPGTVYCNPLPICCMKTFDKMHPAVF